MAGMRLKDYIERLTKEEYEEVFGNIEKEEKKLRAFLGKLDEHLLDPVATMLNDTGAQSQTQRFGYVAFAVGKQSSVPLLNLQPGNRLGFLYPTVAFL